MSRSVEGLASSANPADTSLTQAVEAVGATAQQAVDLPQAVVGASAQMPAYSWSGYFMGIALMFVMLALLWYGARVIKRNGALRLFGMSPALSVESRLSLGQRKHLLVVKYRGKRLLLGVTEHHISVLSDDPLEDGEIAEDAAEQGGRIDTVASANGISGKFKDILHDLNKRK